MSYSYSALRNRLFTDDGQRLFLAVRDQVTEMLRVSGAVTMGRASDLPNGIGAAEGWDLMACVDRMVELGELLEVKRGDVCGQDRVFVRRVSD